MVSASMKAASDAKIARRMPSCLALPHVLSAEARLACSTESKGFLARCRKTFMLLAECRRRIFRAMIAAAQRLQARACARLAKVRGVELLNLKARSARFQASQLLGSVKNSKERFEAALAVAVVPRLSNNMISRGFANRALRCCGAGKSKHLKYEQIKYYPSKDA